MKRILVAVDTTPNAPLVLSEAVVLARSLAAKLRLFHVVPMPAPPPPPGIFVVPPAMQVRERVACAEHTLNDLARAIPDELRDGVCVDVGNAADRICCQVRSYDPDLLVIGAHEYGLVARALGTTAARIVNRLDRPVFVVRPMPESHHTTSEPSARAG